MESWVVTLPQMYALSQQKWELTYVIIWTTECKASNV